MFKNKSKIFDQSRFRGAYAYSTMCTRGQNHAHAYSMICTHPLAQNM